MDIIEIIEWASTIAGLVLAAAGWILSFYSARKRKSPSLFYYLVTMFFACIFISNAYFLLVWFLSGYPYVFSPGDLSWLGAIVFLITADLYIADTWTREQKEAAGKFRLPALAAPCVCVIFNAAYIRIYPELIINYLVYAVPTAILSYLALWLFLASLKVRPAGCAIQPAMRVYHLSILVWISVQLFNDLFSSLGADSGFSVHASICEFLLAIATLAIYFAARKEAGA